MDRRIAESAVLAALAIVALALASATLPSTTDPGLGPGSGPALGGGGSHGVIPTPEPRRLPAPDPGVLSWLVTAFVVVALLAFVAYLVLYRREAIQYLLGLVVLLLVLVLLFWLASQFDLGPSGYPGWGGSVFGAPGGGGSTATPSPRPPLLLLAVLGVVLVGAVALFLRTGRFRRLRPPDEDVDEGPTVEAVAVGRAAGRAADRIEASDDLDNEIYRAWRELTDLLDVDRPGATTAGEFEAAAARAGMDRTDVAALTRLFEDVRYGGVAPTASNQRRAVAILRRVEATYVPAEEEEA